ncbi:MAG: sensor histidine kinase [Bacteroidales bacterium]|jgi:hypothetical protein|nr:sensor histidine kinase [Bacteroidales bacterium]MDD4394878.1 sensor histidine kinase [Bacteroidales bacterium]
MKKNDHLQSILSTSISVCFGLIILLFFIFDKQPNTSQWSFDAKGALHLIPFLLIYLSIELWLFPRYLKNNRLTQYLILSISCVLVVTVIWYFFITPYLPSSHEGGRKEDMGDPMDQSSLLILNGREQAQLVEMIDSDTLSGAAILTQFSGERPGFPSAPPPPRRKPPFFVFAIFGLSVFAFFTTMKFILKMIQTENEKKEMERLKVEAELKLLKYQLNPHFLMNSLNNIHALIDIDGEAAQTSVRILSKMMRYMLYDTNQEKVELYKEIDFLQNYFDLMRKRYIDKVDITFLYPNRIPRILIPPALFINLVENSFKHGVSYVERSFIFCEILMDDHFVICHVKNSKPTQQNAEPKENGYGLDINTKRLDILYPHQYVFRVNETATEYQVELKIPVS